METKKEWEMWLKDVRNIVLCSGGGKVTDRGIITIILQYEAWKKRNKEGNL